MAAGLAVAMALGTVCLSAREARASEETDATQLPLEGSTSEIAEKADTSSVTKEVREDSSQEWRHTADSHVGQVIEYRLIGTLTANYEAYDSYHLCLTDTLSPGLRLEVPQDADLSEALEVRIDGKAVPLDGDHVKLSYEGNVLVIDLADLRDAAWADHEIGGSSIVSVSYRASLTDQAAVGKAGNQNEAYLTYTCDPLTKAEDRTVEARTQVFTYQLELTKLDGRAGTGLGGARFTIRVAGRPADGGTSGPYLQPDGSLGTQAHEFETDATGKVTVSGLDEGTYLISETKAPEGFERLAGDLTLVVMSELDDQELGLSRLTATVEASQAKVSAVDSDSGCVHVTVSNTPSPRKAQGQPTSSGSKAVEKLAQTGVGPVAEALLACGLVLVGISRARRRGR